MKLSNYIIKFFAEHGITDIYGYPGGCINHLIDSAFRDGRVKAHLSYNEQGAAFAACGYAQKSGNVGAAYSTSGPGAVNLAQGIASAYFDYIPVIFITGNVDSDAERGNMNLRQRGFQETDIVSLYSGITKKTIHVSKPEDIKYWLEYAYFTVLGGGMVL